MTNSELINKIENLIDERLNDLIKGRKKLPEEVLKSPKGNKKRIEPAIKQVTGRIFELRKIKRELKKLFKDLK